MQQWPCVLIVDKLHIIIRQSARERASSSTVGFPLKLFACVGHAEWHCKKKVLRLLHAQALGISLDFLNISILIDDLG